jgi:serine/threonine protein kinase
MASANNHTFNCDLGGVSTVALVHDNVSGTKRAVKRIKDNLLRPFGNAHRLFREIEILRQLHHPNIVKLVALVPPR